MLRPRVARYGSNGIHVSLVDEEKLFDDSCSIVLDAGQCDASAACKKAAARLRKMADALDIIAESDRPFHEETAIAAVRAVKKPSGQETQS